MCVWVPPSATVPPPCAVVPVARRGAALGPFRLGEGASLAACGAGMRGAPNLPRPHSPRPAWPQTHRPSPVANPGSPPTGPRRGRRPSPSPATRVACHAACAAPVLGATAVARRRGWPTGNERAPPLVALAGRARSPARPAHHGRQPYVPPTLSNTCRRGGRETYPPGPCRGPPRGRTARARPVGDIPANAQAGRGGAGLPPRPATIHNSNFGGLGDMKQRILGYRAPPRHRRTVIAHSCSAALQHFQTSAEC